jgi:nitrite reductase/ring-hydroxylating ferredoxin subunit
VCPTADVVEATEHPTKYEYTVTGRKRVKPGSRTTTLGARRCCRVLIHGRSDQVIADALGLHGLAGMRVTVNGMTLALFKYEGEFFAIQNTCPHQGASLHLGDIEDFDGTLCVSCPRHKWPFSLEDGDCMIPVDLRAECYPVDVRRQRDGTNMLFVGFDSFSDSLFSDEDF